MTRRDAVEILSRSLSHRCACGARPSWAHLVSGTAGTPAQRVAWAGCPYCRGTAVGPAVDDAIVTRACGRRSLAAVQAELEAASH